MHVDEGWGLKPGRSAILRVANLPFLTKKTTTAPNLAHMGSAARGFESLDSQLACCRLTLLEAGLNKGSRLNRGNTAVSFPPMENSHKQHTFLS